MSQIKIMLVCESCSENFPEGCGHYSMNDLRICRDGRWLCESCFDEDRGTRDQSWDKARKLSKAGIVEAAMAVLP